MSTLSLQSLVRKSDKILAQNLDDDTVMANIHTGYYFGVGNTGKRIWELVEDRTTPGEICQKLGQEYRVDAARCESEVLAFVQELINEGLVDLV